MSKKKKIEGVNVVTPILLQNRQEMPEIQWWKPKHLASELAR